MLKRKWLPSQTYVYNIDRNRGASFGKSKLSEFDMAGTKWLSPSLSSFVLVLKIELIHDQDELFGNNAAN